MCVVNSTTQNIFSVYFCASNTTLNELIIKDIGISTLK